MVIQSGEMLNSSPAFTAASGGTPREAQFVIVCGETPIALASAL